MQSQEGTMLKTEQHGRVELFGLDSNQAAPGEIQVGDLVRTGSNRFPHYAVIAVYDDMAWVRDVQNGVDGLTAVNRCHKINGAPALNA